MELVNLTEYLVKELLPNVENISVSNSLNQKYNLKDMENSQLNLLLNKIKNN